MKIPITFQTVLVGSALVGLGVACGEELPPTVPTLSVQGALIDGSEDPLASAPAREVNRPPRKAMPTPVEVAANETEGVEPTATAVEPEEPAEPEAEVEAEVLVETEVAPVETPEPVVEEAQPKGPLSVTYQDLSLIDYDVDAMLDYMLFPEEYEGEDKSYLELPSDIKNLDGKELSIVGYMIPGEMDKGNVRDFMLVRDLMGCCFGGTPMPDEWVDVTMDADAKAEYRPYMPMRVTGVMTLGGEQDEAGFALGIYRLKASKVQLED